MFSGLLMKTVLGFTNEITYFRSVKSDLPLIFPDPNIDDEKAAAMVESFFTLLLTTLGVTKLIGTSPSRDQLRKEVINLLSIEERGHADLMENIPGLADVAEYDVGNSQLKITDLGILQIHRLHRFLR